MRHEAHGHGARGKYSPDLPLHSADEYVKVLLPFAECSNMSPSQITLLPSGLCLRALLLVALQNEESIGYEKYQGAKKEPNESDKQTKKS